MAEHRADSSSDDFDEEHTQRRNPVRPILVALDFSNVSREALAWAIDYATAVPGELHTVHVVDRHFRRGDLFADPGDLKRELDEVHAEAGAELERQVSDEHRQKVGPLHEHVSIGRPADEILAVAGEIDAGLIVVGSHGKGAVERALLGSVAEHVVRGARCPVIVVKRTQP
jgi:nucleotide-binding universal stress UspA family protein